MLSSALSLSLTPAGLSIGEWEMPRCLSIFSFPASSQALATDVWCCPAFSSDIQLSQLPTAIKVLQVAAEAPGIKGISEEVVFSGQLISNGLGKLIPSIFYVFLSFGFCHSPVDFCAHSYAYPCSLPLTLAQSCSLLLTPACADARISMGEWQKSVSALLLKWLALWICSLCCILCCTCRHTWQDICKILWFRNNYEGN